MDLRRLLFLASSLLLACEEPRPPPAAQPLVDQEKPKYEVAQSAVDGAISIEVDGYEATRVEWAGLEPVRFTVERFQRRRCFERATYRPGPRGNFVLERLEARSGPTGGPAAPGKVLLSEAVEAVAGPRREGFWHQRDPLGRLVWTFERTQVEGEARPRITQVNVRYDPPESCTLPRSYDRAELPARIDPGATPPRSVRGGAAAKPPAGRPDKAPMAPARQPAAAGEDGEDEAGATD